MRGDAARRDRGLWVRVQPHPARAADWHHLLMVEEFIELAKGQGLRLAHGHSAEGDAERSLYSPDMVYRYAFGRWWDEQQLAATVVWVLLNPATGDTELRRRPTLDRCITWSRNAGHAGIVIVNLFAFRDTNPKNLGAARDPVGPANDEVLRVLTKSAACTITAWGGRGGLNGRASDVAPVLTSPMCLGTTKRGQPRHPLYVPSAQPLIEWSPC